MTVIRDGDVIRYNDARMQILGPNKISLNDKEVNESSIVALLSVDGVRALFTGDIGTKTERQLIERYHLLSDILKVPHHGSKYSSSNIFLEAASPRAAFIGVGKNSYGHPTSEVLARFESIGSKIFRTDMQGTLKVIIRDGKIAIYSQGALQYNESNK
jgi:competence protein ComEC